MAWCQFLPDAEPRLRCDQTIGKVQQNQQHPIPRAALEPIGDEACPHYRSGFSPVPLKVANFLTSTAKSLKSNGLKT